MSIKRLDASLYKIAELMPSEDAQKELIAGLSPEEAYALLRNWEFIARPEQIIPRTGDWRYYLLLTGRAWGKTRTIVEWIHREARENPGVKIAIVSATSSDITKTLMLGMSGFYQVIPSDQMPSWNKKDQTLTWANGSQAYLYSADEPERIRGFSGHRAVCDEFAAWRRPMAFTMLDMALREGDDGDNRPRCVVATTPRTVPHLISLKNRPDCITIHGTTFDNSANLSQAYFDSMKLTYGNSRLSQQELYGQILEDSTGAIWSESLVESCRIETLPELERIVIGVDPAMSSEIGANKTGIIVCGIDRYGTAYVIADRSVKGKPEDWARAVVQAYYDYEADMIAAETNQGGDLVVNNIYAIDSSVNVGKVTSMKSKKWRAETVHLFYTQGRVKHLGDRIPDMPEDTPLESRMQVLEYQMTNWLEGDPESPDEMDAMVHALRHLLIDDGHQDSIPYRTGVASFSASSTW